MPTIEQLLKLIEANKNKLKPDRGHVNDVHKFIDDLKIKPGKFKVKNGMLYKAYVMWGGKKKFTSFIRMFSQYFDPNTEKRDFKHYLINMAAVQLINKVDKGLVKI